MMITPEVASMTSTNEGGVIYEEIGPSSYRQHTCDWDAAFTWCGEPTRSLRRSPDPKQTPKVEACAQCARLEAEAATAKKRPPV